MFSFNKSNWLSFPINETMKVDCVLLIQESTKDVEIVSFMERPRQNRDVQVYEFEYKLDSTRGGLKRIFSAAFVVSKKLYLLNIAHSDDLQQPIDNHRRMILEQVLHSFDVVTPPSIRTTFNHTHI